jgi:hypothetical protein
MGPFGPNYTNQVMPVKSNVEPIVAQSSRGYTTFALSLVAVVLIVGFVAYLTLSPMGKTTTATITYAPNTTEVVSATNSSAGQLGTWGPTTPYPLAEEGFSCVSSGSYMYCPRGHASCVANGQFIYCIGAAVNNVYFSRIST